MKENFEKIEEEISRATNEKDRADLKSSLFDLRAQAARHAFEDEIIDARNKALRRKLLPVEVICVVTVILTTWWHVSLFINGGHYTMHQRFVTFVDQPILYTINAIGWVSLAAIAMVFLYWIIKLILIDRQNTP